MVWDRTRSGLVMLMAVTMVACGGGQEATPRGAGEESEAAAAAPAVDPAVAATIRGAIAFEGSPQEASAIDMSEEQACADKYTTGAPMTEKAVVAGGRLANVFVYVKEGLTGTFPAPAEPVVLDQVGCRYLPHVLGVQTGQTLLIRNSDPVLHNINTQPSVNRGFNVSQPQEGMESRREFRRAEVMIPVKCDVHGWMSAYVGVVDHPYHAVSGSDGSFSLSSLPPGTYMIEAWHEVYGVMSQEVTVGEAETAEIGFTFSADMAGRDVPLGEPLVIHAHGTTDMGASARAARRTAD